MFMRRRKGTPAGGQFAYAQHGESDIHLDNPKSEAEARCQAAGRARRMAKIQWVAIKDGAYQKEHI